MQRPTVASSVRYKATTCKSLQVNAILKYNFGLGMMRFSTPMCQPLLKWNETCRPNVNQIKNATFSYPNGLQISLIDGYQVRILL